MEGSNCLDKGKRRLDDDDDDNGDELPEKKRRWLSESGSSRCSFKQEPNQQQLRLQFVSRFPCEFFTERKVEGEKGSSIRVELFDAATGGIVTSGPVSSAKLNVVALEGSFKNGDDEDWDSVEFEKHVVKEREGHKPLLVGDLQVQLKQGVGILGNISFTDNSSWVPSKMFRLGLKVAPNCCVGIRIREAKTAAFRVKDRRGELYKKHHPPALDDQVWRLEGIGKDGAFCKRLNGDHIWTVRDFLRHLAVDPKKLQETLGLSASKNRKWEALVDHARTCILNEKKHVYRLDDSRTLVFNDIYELKGLFANNNYYSVADLSNMNNVSEDYVNELLRKAYEDFKNIEELDAVADLDLQLNGTSSQQLFSHWLPIPVNPIQPALKAHFPSQSTNLNEIPTATNGMHSQTNANSFLQNSGTSPPLQNQIIHISSQTQNLVNDGMTELSPGSPGIPITMAGILHNLSESSPYSPVIIEGGCSFSDLYSPISCARKSEKQWGNLVAILSWRFNMRRKIIKARQRLAAPPLMRVSVSS